MSTSRIEYNGHRLRSNKLLTVNQQCDYDNCHALNCDNLFDYVTMTAIVHGFQLEEVIP